MSAGQRPSRRLASRRWTKPAEDGHVGSAQRVARPAPSVAVPEMVQGEARNRAKVQRRVVTAFVSSGLATTIATVANVGWSEIPAQRRTTDWAFR
jgi:hypothetical protein